MLEAYEIGISLALQDGVSSGIALIRQDLSALDRAIAATAQSLSELQKQAGQPPASPSISSPHPTSDTRPSASLTAQEPDQSAIPTSPPLKTTEPVRVASTTPIPAVAVETSQRLPPPERVERAAPQSGPSLAPALPSQPTLPEVAGRPAAPVTEAVAAPSPSILPPQPPMSPAPAVSDRNVPPPPLHRPSALATIAVPPPVPPGVPDIAATSSRADTASRLAVLPALQPPYPARATAALPAPVSASAPAALQTPPSTAIAAERHSTYRLPDNGLRPARLPIQPASPGVPKREGPEKAMRFPPSPSNHDDRTTRPSPHRMSAPAPSAAPAVRPTQSRQPTQTSSSSAPPPPAPQLAITLAGDVILDGARVGRWMTNNLARQAARPPAGPTGPDPRQTPLWSGQAQGY